MTAYPLATAWGQIDLNEPRFDADDLEELLWVLASIRRFGGHMRPAWSILDHSLAVEYVTTELAQLDGSRQRAAVLMHDAHEAIFGDLPRPLRLWMQTRSNGALQMLERQWHDAITTACGIEGLSPFTAHVMTYVDAYSAFFEWRSIGGHACDWMQEEPVLERLFAQVREWLAGQSDRAKINVALDITHAG